jgi:hypothetical protein
MKMVPGEILELDAQRTEQRSGQGEKAFDLAAPPLIAQRPGAEVLAVVGQDAVARFAQARECALHHFATIEASVLGLNAHGSATRETLERNLFHRSAPQPVCKTSVVNDATIAGVDAVVGVERARCDEVGGERGFAAGFQMYITVLDVACIVSPPDHVKDSTA